MEQPSERDVFKRARARATARFAQLPRPTRWLWLTAAGTTLVIVSLADLLISNSVTLAALYAIAPMVAALGATTLQTALIGGASTVLAIVSVLLEKHAAGASIVFQIFGDKVSEQDIVRVVSVVLISVLAIWTAHFRERLVTSMSKERVLAESLEDLLAERAYVARTLQNSLLPPHLPTIPVLDVAAAYVPAGEGNEVGGDFYDCFEINEHEWALVIGDVCGKGAGAAAITALARYTIRALVLQLDSPREILAQLNEAILRQVADFRFCTVLYIRIRETSDGLQATIATGGHPLPLLARADGSVVSVGMPGTLLGVLTNPNISETTIELHAQECLILYTDGIIDATKSGRELGPGELGPEGFVDVVTSNMKSDPSVLANAITQDALRVQGGQLRDDIAVLVARVKAHPISERDQLSADNHGDCSEDRTKSNCV